MPVDPPTDYTETSGQELYNVALSLRLASLPAPATAGAISLISGHALHLVVRLVLEKLPERLPCPFVMRL